MVRNHQVGACAHGSRAGVASLVWLVCVRACVCVCVCACVCGCVHAWVVRLRRAAGNAGHESAR